MKVIYFDVETTGKDAVKNDIIQLAGIIEIDGEIKETFNLKMQPFDYENIVPEALEVNHTTLEELKGYQTPSEAYKSFVRLLGRYVNKFDSRDKFYPAGFNVRFDVDFLKEWFSKNGDVYYGSWFNYKLIDPLPVLHMMEYCGKISLMNYKLSTVCEHLNIAIDAHDALSDITATRDLITYIKEKIQ